MGTREEYSGFEREWEFRKIQKSGSFELQKSQVSLQLTCIHVKGGFVLTQEQEHGRSAESASLTGQRIREPVHLGMGRDPRGHCSPAERGRRQGEWT